MKIERKLALLLIIVVILALLTNCKKDDKIKPIHSVNVTPKPQHYQGVCYGGYTNYP